MTFITKILGWIKSLFGFGKKPQPVAAKPTITAPLSGAALAEALNKQTTPLSGAALAEELNKQSPAATPAKKAKKPVAKKNKKKE